MAKQEEDTINKMEKSITNVDKPELIESGHAEFHTFSSKKTLLDVDFRKGTALPIERKDIDFLKPLTQIKDKDLKHYQHTLPITVGNATSYPLPLGLTIISGATAVGKSTFLRMLDGVERLLCVEVPDNLEELKTKYLYDSDTAALAAAIIKTGKQGQLCAIDSLRSTLFEINGAAGPKGIIMEFFTNITRVSNSLASNGLSMIATVNPMHEDPEYEKAFLSKLSSAVPCFISLNNVNEKSASGTISSRDCRSGAPFTMSGKSVVKSEAVKLVSYNFNDDESQPVLSPIQVAQLDKHNY
jgi:hypothetical protein